MLRITFVSPSRSSMEVEDVVEEQHEAVFAKEGIVRGRVMRVCVRISRLWFGCIVYR